MDAAAEREVLADLAVDVEAVGVAVAAGGAPPLRVKRNETRSRYSRAASRWPKSFGITPAGNPETVPFEAGSRIFPMMYSGVWLPAMFERSGPTGLAPIAPAL